MDSTPQLLNKLAFASRRVLEANRVPVALTAGAALLLALTIAFYLNGKSALQQERLIANDLLFGEHRGADSVKKAVPSKIELKSFRSSLLLEILERGAAAVNIKLDEISFAVDDSPNQPYVRYRATFTVISRYPTIRKFISEILAGTEGVVLDTVACRREDIAAADVRCDISAYVAYQEKVSG
jgi:hypothetical protein